MKLINPNYTRPAGPLSAVKTTIDNWFAANTDKRSITFDQLRANFGKSEEEWPDGAIHQQLKDWGYTVEE